MSAPSTDRTTSRWRDWFRRAVDPECRLTLPEVRDLVADADRLLRECPGQTPAWAERPAPDVPSIRAILRGSQPMAAALGGALATLSAPGVFEDSVQLRLMAVLAHDLGVGGPGASRFDAFHRIMTAHRLTQEALPRPQLPESRVPDELFAAPAVVIALSRRPDLFTAELLGWDQQLRSRGMLAPWAWLRDADVNGDWSRLDLASTADGTPGLDKEVADCIAAADLGLERVAWGATAAECLLRQWDLALWRWTDSSSDPREAMVDLMSRRAREAVVYHDKSRLDGRSIQSWFAEARQDPRDFVEALGTSRYVRPGQPERSILLTKLTEFGSPMFRVFSPEDREIIARWILWLDEQRTTAEPTATPEVPERSAPLDAHLAAMADPAADAESPQSIREAYVALQGRHCPPAVLRFADEYVDYWLSLARRSMDRHPFPLPAELPSPGDLREWLLAAHDKHSDTIDLKHNAQHLPSREEVIDSTVQLSPLTLIDGSWLMGYTDVSLASTRVGYSLFETYWDELGNGDIEINHPKLYRDVLAGMDIDLPPTHSPEFASSDHLRDEAFELPVYWLAIGRYPVSRQPEVLGLNLAMELSGVGGSYRTARQAFRAYGFPTIFVDIHNTIDNVSTGHSAWAAEAIESYLESARAFGAEPADLEALWMRVRTGFASLDPDRTKRFGFTGSRIGESLRRRLKRGAGSDDDADPAPLRGVAHERRLYAFAAAHNQPLSGPWRRDPGAAPTNSTRTLR